MTINFTLDNGFEIGNHLLGRNKEHDERSLNYLFAAEKVAAADRVNVFHHIAGPCLNQGKVGSCEGNTAAEFLNTNAATNNRAAYNKLIGHHAARTLTEADAVHLYSTATTLDNNQITGTYPPTDTGTSGLGIAKALKALGGLKTYSWTKTFDAFLAALQARPVMLGTDWYESMFNTDPDGYVIAPGSGDKPDGGHAYLAFALDWTNSRIGCTNHWTDKWGVTINDRQGCFWQHFDLCEQLLITEQGDMLLPGLL